nr:RecName: Full=23 kDa cell wall protein [Solanum lycopersicum]
ALVEDPQMQKYHKH